MERRDFCKALGGAATAMVASNGLPRALAAGAHKPESSDYAGFCAIPESERNFSVVSEDRIVPEKLDQAGLPCRRLHIINITQSLLLH